MKKGRHQAIIELIRKYDIENQNVLAYKLAELGYDVTQATVSRDIQKLNLIKVKTNNKFKYAVVENANAAAGVDGSASIIAGNGAVCDCRAAVGN